MCWVGKCDVKIAKRDFYVYKLGCVSDEGLILMFSIFLFVSFICVCDAFSLSSLCIFVDKIEIWFDILRIVEYNTDINSSLFISQRGIDIQNSFLVSTDEWIINFASFKFSFIVKFALLFSISELMWNAISFRVENDSK